MGCMKICGSFYITPKPQGLRPILSHCFSPSPCACLGSGSAQCDYTIILRLLFSHRAIVFCINQGRTRTVFCHLQAFLRPEVNLGRNELCFYFRSGSWVGGYGGDWVHVPCLGYGRV